MGHWIVHTLAELLPDLRGQRQLEPRAILQARPVRPASLPAAIQGGDPLAPYFLPYPFELVLAVV